MYGNACGVGVAVRAGPADLDPTHARKRTEKHQGTFFNHQPHGIGRSFFVHLPLLVSFTTGIPTNLRVDSEWKHGCDHGKQTYDLSFNTLWKDGKNLQIFKIQRSTAFYLNGKANTALSYKQKDYA